MNAFTFGETNVYVCISSSCVERLDDEELMCLMAHECGHILCKHVLYESVVGIIQDIGDDFGIIPYTLAGPIYLALKYWSRRSEFSADRCAAATMGEVVFQRMTLKMVSGLQDTGNDYYQFVRQAKEYHSLENSSLWNKIQQNCRVAFYSHPQMVNRAYEIDRWKGSYSYNQLRSVLAQ
jgi:Zn-dependent protease with chaperone function